MIVKRIVSNIASNDVAKARSFYADILGLDVVMDQGWIVTFASAFEMAPQISVASQGGSGTAVPDISIEVDDLWEALRRVKSYQEALKHQSLFLQKWEQREYHHPSLRGRYLFLLGPSLFYQYLHLGGRFC